MVSQVNNCEYCRSAHSKFAKMNGFTDEQIMEIRIGQASFDPKFEALVKLAKASLRTKDMQLPKQLITSLPRGYTKGSSSM
ncbi:carboxymuconolactone decarboxylase family protein [Mucilaginibacter sp. P25]|uniref:carboxymuconolactone decarboxylase family protein n=1 Tax=Mucilaginibacter TaxID=423349 RepID=UPI00210C6F9C|nr:carboxymuconolactone decarboxylase family protein [Mucilaginibacter gossypii]